MSKNARHSRPPSSFFVSFTHVVVYLLLFYSLLCYFQEMLDRLQHLSQDLTTARQKCDKLKNEQGELDGDIMSRAEETKAQMDDARQQVRSGITWN